MRTPATTANEVVVRLPHKAKAMDRALDLVSEGELKPGDIAVLWFICTSMDNQKGECVRRYKTIAKSCNVSRPAAVRAIARLKSFGLIGTRERFYKKSKSKTATAYRLGALPPAAKLAAKIGSRMNQGSVHRCTIMVSRLSRIPTGDQHSEKYRGQGSTRAKGAPTEPSPDAKWSELKAWLSKQGRYSERWGHGASQLASDDLDRLRRERGDRALLRAIENAKSKRLYGGPLIDFLEHTFPMRPRRSA